MTKQIGVDNPRAVVVIFVEGDEVRIGFPTASSALEHLRKIALMGETIKGTDSVVMVRGKQTVAWIDADRREMAEAIAWVDSARKAWEKSILESI